jgi:hypothetical protein
MGLRPRHGRADIRIHFDSSNVLGEKFERAVTRRFCGRGVVFGVPAIIETMRRIIVRDHPPA